MSSTEHLSVHLPTTDDPVTAELAICKATMVQLSVRLPATESPITVKLAF